MNTATRWAMGISGAVLMVLGGGYVFTKRNEIRVSLNNVIPNLKNKVVTSVRSTYGRMANAADGFVHTERDPQVPTA